MVDMTLDRWIPFRNEDAAVRCRIFCLPHAAGSAAYYLPLRRIMPPEIDFCPLELPGHGARLDEQPIASMGELMEQLRRAIQPLMAVPFGFFGHSVGAHMAYEATRQMRAIDGRTAVHLFVSARGSPDRTSGAAAPAPRLRSDCELLAILERFGGTAPAITQRPKLVSAILRALQADLLLVGRVSGRSAGSHELADHRIWRVGRCPFRLPWLMAEIDRHRRSTETMVTAPSTSGGSATLPEPRGRSHDANRCHRQIETGGHQGYPELTKRHISPHTIRHSTAMHLLQAGVDLTVIALWLGHESTATTHMYVEADLAMKELALNAVRAPRIKSKRFRPTEGILAFLEGL
jgi:surfactin synthase thioesterase subunit